MREPEQFVVPALGVFVVLSAFILGTGFLSLAYPIVLGGLGLAAVGTYFLPPAVQVELRIAIAGLGLLTLIFMFSSLGFWLALIGFGAIGALQIRHRGVLQKSLHTVEWLKTLQLGQGRARTGMGPAETGGATTAAQPVASQPVGVSEGGGRVNVGSIGAMVLGIIVLASFLLTWVTLPISIGGPFARAVLGRTIDERINLSGLELVRMAIEISGEVGEDAAFLYVVPAVAGVIAVLALLGIASIALPRRVPMIAGIAGTVIMALLFIGFTATLAQARSELRSRATSEFGPGVESALELASRAEVINVSPSLGIGFWLALLAFLIMAGMQLAIVRGNR